MTEHCPDHSNLMQDVGAIKADVAHIKSKVDNGLSSKLVAVETALNTFMLTAQADRRVDQAENWFTRMLQGSATKIAGLAVLCIMGSGLTSSGFTMLAKQYISQEPPGQQKEILTQSMELTKHAYHSHLLPDGRTLLHAGDSTAKAWILDPATGTYSKCPEMRTEQGLK